MPETATPSTPIEISGTLLTAAAVSPSVKPGWRTSEFWLKLAAIVLSALFASGVIPSTGPAATVAVIAATMLGALGYAVVRGNVKAAASYAAATAVNDNASSSSGKAAA